MEQEMEELRFNATGTDAVYMANSNRFFSTLFTLGVFRNDWREDKLGSQSVLQSGLDYFREMYEGGRVGNRLHIAARNLTRKKLNVRIQKILHYVAIFADENDIATLLSTGVVTRKSNKRARRTQKLAAAA